MLRDLLSVVVVKAMILKGYMDLHSMQRNTVNARKKNEKLLFKMIKWGKNTEFGREHHFSEIKTVEDYRRLVPMATYADFDPYIQRMINDEKNILTSLPLVGYAQSSGSVGKRKFVPLTQPDINIYTKYTVTRMLAIADKYCRQKTGRGLRAARGMYTGPAYDDFLPNGLLCSNVPDVAGRQLGFLYPYFINIPFNHLFNVKDIDFRYINSRLALEDKNCLFLFSVFFKDVSDYMRFLEKNWRQLADDIEKGVISDFARPTPETRKKLEKVLRPKPERAEEIRREFEKGFDETIIHRLWPNMSVISGIGTSVFAPFAKLVRKNTKGIPYDFSIYGASEGLFAACDEMESPKQLLLVDSCYYEFLPVEEKDKVLSLDELEVGKEYEVVITNLSGLYRYRIRDIVKVVGFRNECPYVQFSRREGQLLNVTGEKTTEEHISAVIKEIAKAADCYILDWVVYTRLDEHPYRYVLLIENREGKDMREYEALADQILNGVNPRYKYFVEMNKIGKIELGNLTPGTNKEWMKKQIAKGAPTTQVKPVRILDTPEKEEFFKSRIC